MKPSRGTRTAAVSGFVGVLVLLAWFGARAWWSAGESADQRSWIAVQSQTSWVVDDLRATPADVVEPCSNSLKVGARTWASDRPAAEPQLSQVRARLTGEGWAVRSDDATAVVLAKEFEGRAAEIELVKVAVSDGSVIVSLTMPARFCGL